jgi:hypothetical protein
MRGKLSLKDMLMKRILMVLGASSAFTFAATAHAQNSVTLYGLIDAGLTYTNNQGGSKNFQETSGSMGVDLACAEAKIWAEGLRLFSYLKTASISRMGSWVKMVSNLDVRRS